MVAILVLCLFGTKPVSCALFHSFLLLLLISWGETVLLSWYLAPLPPHAHTTYNIVPDNNFLFSLVLLHLFLSTCFFPGNSRTRLLLSFVFYTKSITGPSNPSHMQVTGKSFSKNLNTLVFPQTLWSVEERN
jgi:hypothetical protein